jgi:hypothetical protein
MESRRQTVLLKIEERIKTSAERELFARAKIRQELVEKAEAGDAEGVREMVAMVAEEAVQTNSKPRLFNKYTVMFIPDGYCHIRQYFLKLASALHFSPFFAFLFSRSLLLLLQSYRRGPQSDWSVAALHCCPERPRGTRQLPSHPLERSRQERRR